MLLAWVEPPLNVRFAVFLSAALEDSMPRYGSHDCTDRRIFVVTVGTHPMMPVFKHLWDFLWPSDSCTLSSLA